MNLTDSQRARAHRPTGSGGNGGDDGPPICPGCDKPRGATCEKHCPEARRLLRIQWWKFHLECPRVWLLFLQYTHQAMQVEHKRKFSGDMVIGRVRWYSFIDKAGRDYKINNNHTALYVRLFVLLHPEHAEFFEMRYGCRLGPITETCAFIEGKIADGYKPIRMRDVIK